MPDKSKLLAKVETTPGVPAAPDPVRDCVAVVHEPWEIRQTHGPTILFNGRQIAQTEFVTRGRDAMSALLEIYETAGGAYIAVSSFVPADRDGWEDIRASVVKPGEDEMARRCAVMDHFQWNVHARKMARKHLGWRLTIEVA